jgi:DNA-binding transcriptional MerR regulator
MHGVSIGEAVERTGASAHTLRYYELTGLIEPIQRAANGRRRYSENDLLWLSFLRRLRATGMSIAQMREFARLREGGDQTARDRRLLLEQHLETIRDQIANLSENLEVLQRKIMHFRVLEDAQLEGHNTLLLPEASRLGAPGDAAARSAT